MVKHLLLLIALSGLTLFAALGQPAITDSDEAFYAESAREMIELGDWLTPHFNYEFRFEKPILYYWLAAASYVVVGEAEWSARLPSALAGFGLMLLAYFIGRQWYNASTGFLGAVITATCFGTVAMAHQALPDLPLAFFITASVWACFNVFSHNLPPTGDRSFTGAWQAIGAFSAGLAFLTKGPVAIALLVGILTLSWIIEYRCFVKWHWPCFKFTSVFCLIFVITTAPWFWGMFNEHGLAYLERFFFAENVERFVTARYNSPRSVFYYLPIVIGGLFPWSPFLILWMPRLKQAVRERTLALATSRLLIWSITPLLFYTISIGKQPRYILPMLVPLSLLLARAILVELSQGVRPTKLFLVAALGSALISLLLAGLLHRTEPLLFEWDRTVVLTVGGLIAISACAVVFSCVMSHMLLKQSMRWTSSILFFVATISIVVSLSTQTVLLASPNTSPVEQMAALIEREQQSGEPYGRHRVFNRNLVYYVQSPHVELPIMRAVKDFLSSSDRVLCVLLEEDFEMLQAEGMELYELGSVSYLNTGSLTLRVLLDPDPTRYVERVLLITNKR